MLINLRRQMKMDGTWAAGITSTRWRAGNKSAPWFIFLTISPRKTLDLNQRLRRALSARCDLRSGFAIALRFLRGFFSAVGALTLCFLGNATLEFIVKQRRRRAGTSCFAFIVRWSHYSQRPGRHDPGSSAADLPFGLQRGVLPDHRRSRIDCGRPGQPFSLSRRLQPRAATASWRTRLWQLFFDVPRTVPALGRRVCLETFDATE